MTLRSVIIALPSPRYVLKAVTLLRRTSSFISFVPFFSIPFCVLTVSTR